jgi:hypothetical protein
MASADSPDSTQNTLAELQNKLEALYVEKSNLNTRVIELTGFDHSRLGYQPPEIMAELMANNAVCQVLREWVVVCNQICDVKFKINVLQFPQKNNK